MTEYWAARGYFLLFLLVVFGPWIVGGLWYWWR